MSGSKARVQINAGSWLHARLYPISLFTNYW